MWVGAVGADCVTNPEEVHSMRKHYPIWLGLCALSLIAVIGLIGRQHVINQATSDTMLVGSLSPRAEEFVTSNSSQGTGLWSEVDLSDNQLAVVAANQRLSTPCFAGVSPWPLIKVKFEVTDGRCVVRARVIDPPAYLTMTSYYQAQPNQDTGLRLRTKNPDVYQPIALSGFTKLDVSGFTAEKEVTVFAWFDTTMFSLALTDIQHPTQLPSADITSLLESLELQPAVPAVTPVASPSPELDLPSEPTL